MTLYTPASIDALPHEQWLATMDNNWTLLQTIDAAAKARGELLWRYVDHPFADGRAVYQIIRVTKAQVRIKVCTGIGDDWVLPAWGHETNIPRTVAERLIRARDGLTSMFGPA